MLDLETNIECYSTMLVQFAVMQVLMAEEVAGIAPPRVTLLNIGEAESKGLNYIHAVAAILQNTPTINYINYLEGNYLLTGKTGVII